jgi:hypothetical protein
VDTENSEILTVPARRNWWKLAFFAMFLLFEIAREIAVLAASQQAEPASTSYVSSLDSYGYVSVKGSWKRIDGGENLLPTSVAIECRENMGKCIEASTWMDKNNVFAPEIDIFDATFTPDMVTYENDYPKCAKYFVRIDLKLQKAFSVRELKKTNKTECSKMEKRIEMQISDGYDKSGVIAQYHFVPILDILGAIIRVFSKFI